jgi:hypothetical protein
MSYEAIIPWLGGALDAAVAVLLACILYRLGRDPERAWREREERLAAIVGDLRLLVAQGEGQARDLDEKLAERGEHIERLLRRAADVEDDAPASRAESRRGAGARAAAGRPAPPAAASVPAAAAIARRASDRSGGASARPAGGSLLERVRVLSEAGVAAGDIAGRLGISVADARMLAALVAARGAERDALPA